MMNNFKYIKPKFFYYLFSKDFIKRVQSMTAKTSVDSVRYEMIDKMKMIIPQENEQEKISNFLSLLDKKIELQSKKIEALKLFKKGIIKRLFMLDYEREITIGQLGNVITGTTPLKDKSEYWSNGDIIWVTPSDINGNRDISNSAIKLTDEGLLHGKFIPKDSILITCIASIGKNAVIKVDGSCNQQINAIVPYEKYNYNYIYYLMENISSYLQSIAGTSATSILNKSQFENVSIKVHSRNIQDEIDMILSVIENKIIYEEMYFDKLYNFKKGLMQTMFV